MKFLITGGAGFIGSAVIRHLINNSPHEVLNLDKLTYAGNLESLSTVDDSDRYKFVQADICESDSLKNIFDDFQPDIVMHLAAESHVDRSIDGPAQFIQTNIVGTYQLLEVSRAYWQSLSDDKQSQFRFHHVSTDEVYGDLGGTNDLFQETTSYAPSSPYSASKASSDHLVRAWNRTYGLPIVITNCSNNYGPYQFPEKLIPHMIFNMQPITDLQAITIHWQCFTRDGIENHVWDELLRKLIRTVVVRASGDNNRQSIGAIPSTYQMV